MFSNKKKRDDTRPKEDIEFKLILAERDLEYFKKKQEVYIETYSVLSKFIAQGFLKEISSKVITTGVSLLFSEIHSTRDIYSGRIRHLEQQVEKLKKEIQNETNN